MIENRKLFFKIENNNLKTVFIVNIKYIDDFLNYWKNVRAGLK